MFDLSLLTYNIVGSLTISSRMLKLSLNVSEVNGKYRKMCNGAVVFRMAYK